MNGFCNALVYTEEKGVLRTSIAINNGIIAKIDDNITLDDTYDIPADAIVTAGFIDEHIHGCSGFDTMDGSVPALKAIAEGLAKEGTTSFLATTMTQSLDKIKNAISAVNRYIEGDFPFGARLLGAHLEGPFISKKYVGAQPENYVIAPNTGAFESIESVSGGHIKIVTMCAEEEGSAQLIKYLKSKKISVNIGHSAATFENVAQAVSLGADAITHTYNAQSPFHHREAGVVGAALLTDSLYCELIADLIHVCPAAIRLLFKTKPKDKIVLITDSIRAKNLHTSVSELGGEKVFVIGKKACLKDGTLAGSVLKMNEAVKNTVKCGIGFTEAVNAATINPAMRLGIDKRAGSIAVGKSADFTVLNKNFDILLTVRDGKVIYKA